MTPTYATSMVQHDAAQPQTRVGGEFLSFRLGAEEYGIEILCVQEIRGYAEPTRIANAPALLKGVLSLRGVMVPIVDLRRKFAVEPRYDSATVTIVLNLGRRVVGVVVDAVSDVIALASAQIKPAPAISCAAEARHITGFGSLKNGDVERMLILLDIEHLMASPDMGLVDATH